jgi:hypothetical protein
MRHAVATSLVALAAVSCSLSSDPPAPYQPDPLGSGLRVRNVQDPGSSNYSPNRDVNLTSITVLWVDTFDETQDGKSKGTVYIQDVASQNPYSGISVFQPSYVPADLSPLPGDVLDFVGPYQEVKNIGTAVFSPPQTLPQLAKPVGTFRYEFETPPPTVIHFEDLNDYKKGRPWEGMLVTVKNVYLGGAQVDTSGYRITYPLLPSGTGAPPANSVAISNELYNLQRTDFKAGTHLTSVTGIVTWFFSFHIAPRTPADIVQ